MVIRVTTLLNCTPQRAWEEVQTSRLLHYITAPLVRFTAIAPPTLPALWDTASYHVQMHLFGWLPFGRQWIVITTEHGATTPGQQQYTLRDNGHGDVVAVWDHRIVLREAADGRTHYTDQVTIQAGWLTLFIWLYAQIFYRYRQYRWRRLVARGFVYPPHQEHTR
jgi:hypothetical protein